MDGGAVEQAVAAAAVASEEAVAKTPTNSYIHATGFLFLLSGKTLVWQPCVLLRVELFSGLEFAERVCRGCTTAFVCV